MIEILKHALGFCGEVGHPSLLTLLASGVGLTSVITYIKLKIKSYDKSKP